MRRFICSTTFLFALALASNSNASAPSSKPLPTDNLPKLAQNSSPQLLHKILVQQNLLPQGVQFHYTQPRRIGELTVHHFDQTYQGLTVAYHGTGLALDAAGNIVVATSRILSDFPASIHPAIDAGNAAKTASSHCGLDASPDHARLVIWPTEMGSFLAWVVSPPATFPIPYAPVVIVDAQSGEVITTLSRVHFKNKANLYQFNPVSTPTPSEITLPIDDPSTVPQNKSVVSYNCVDTKTTKDVNYMGMKFPVHICELKQNAIAGADGDYFDYSKLDDTSGGDPFAELSIFYHANVAYDWFRGFNPDFKLTEKAVPLFAVANVMMPAGYSSMNLAKMKDPSIPLEPFSNAFYTGWDPTLAPLMSIIFPEVTGSGLYFGQGNKIDFSYDGDVVYHEFGHAVVDSTLRLVGTWHLDKQGALPAPGSMNEALADYFSSAIAGDPKQGEYAAKDIGSNLEAIRNLDNSKTCPEYLAGEVHADSEFFSAALWKVRASLTDLEKHGYDQAIFQTLAAGGSGDLGYEDLAEAFLKTLAKSSPGQAVSDALKTEFEARGILPGCNRIFEFKGTPIASKPAELQGLFFASGKSDFLSGSKLPYAPGLFQAKYALPSGATTVTFKFKEQKLNSTSLPGQTTAKPFTPAVLFSFDTPISFETSPSLTTNALPPVTASLSQSLYSATIVIPAGAKTAYAMLVNKGDSQGAYTQIKLETSSDPIDAGQDAAPIEDADTVDSGDVVAPGTSPADDSGCGCRVQTTGGKSFWTIALAALAILGLRRKKAPTRLIWS